MAKKPSKKKHSIEMTLWDVILSFPDVFEPKPYMGKIRYKTDVLLEADHSQLKELKHNISLLKKEAFGEDKAEWPLGAKKRLLLDGNEREDQKTYKDRFWITAGSNQPVPIVDLAGKAFNAQSVRGGMQGNVAITICYYDYEGKEGVTIYLNGIQVDTKAKLLPGFGGGPSIEKMFGKGKKVPASEESEEDDDIPHGKKSKKASINFDDEDTGASKKKKSSPKNDEEE